MHYDLWKVISRELDMAPPRPIITKAVELGVGGAQAWLEVQRAPVSWGDTLRGDLVLQGGLAAHWINQPVEVRLGYTQDEVVRTLGSQILLRGPHAIQPGTNGRFPFQLVVSNATPLWREVRLECGIQFARWRQEFGLRIRVLPPEVCSEISAQFCEIAGMQLVYFEMTAPGELCIHLKALNRRSLFTEAHLELSGTTGRWSGRIRVSKRHPWGLYVDEGQIEVPPFPEGRKGIRDHLLRLLQRAGFRPSDLRDLPLPHHARVAADHEFPIAADGGPPTSLPSADPEE